eukprot:5362999-Alexandrium_andersonii.AAC.1
MPSQHMNMPSPRRALHVHDEMPSQQPEMPSLHLHEGARGAGGGHALGRPPGAGRFCLRSKWDPNSTRVTSLYTGCCKRVCLGVYLMMSFSCSPVHPSSVQLGGLCVGQASLPGPSSEQASSDRSTFTLDVIN